MLKQYIVVRQDLKMPKGKLAGQVAHASIGASRVLPNHVVEKWMEDKLQTKIILKVQSLDELLEYYDECEYNNLSPYLVTNLTEDKWHNEQTCFAVGPCNEEDLNGLFENLKLL